MISMKSKWFEVSKSLTQKKQLEFLMDSMMVNKAHLPLMMGFLIIGISWFPLLILSKLFPYITLLTSLILFFGILMLFINYYSKLLSFRRKWYR